MGKHSLYDKDVSPVDGATGHDAEPGRGTTHISNIYEIPVSSPSHSVTYVTVQENNDDAVVFVNDTTRAKQSSSFHRGSDPV
jgi:hypothetical protein